jgi:hypothetical protein
LIVVLIQLALQVAQLIGTHQEPVTHQHFRWCLLQGSPLQSGPSSVVFLLLQVVELIWITVDPATCVPNPEMTGLAQLLVGRVMALRPRFSVALHKATAGALAHTKYDTCRV